MHDFKGKIVLVTGATRGIGKAITAAFLKRDATVIGVYGANREAADSFKQELNSINLNPELIQCDIANESDVAALFEKIEAQHGALDILVNNAGIRKDSIMALMPGHEWQRVLDVNLTGTFLMSKQAVLLMMKKKFGRIINITSPVSHLGFPGQTNYAASKAGQVALTKSLAKETARKKITVNCVSPGFIDTDFINDLPDEQLSSYKKMVPMRRFGKPEEVADAVLFIAGPSSSYITGSVIEVTGGL